MRKIRIDLDSDLSKAIGEIRQLATDIQEIPQKIAESQVQEIQKDYNTVIPPNGTKVTVRNEKSTIIAEGDQIGFVEYGAGTGAVEVPDSPIPTGYGTWSAAEGTGALLNSKPTPEFPNGYWWYNKQRIDRVPAALAMTNAVERIKANGEEIAERGFK